MINAPASRERRQSVTSMAETIRRSLPGAGPWGSNAEVVIKAGEIYFKQFTNSGTCLFTLRHRTQFDEIPEWRKTTRQTADAIAANISGQMTPAQGQAVTHIRQYGLPRPTGREIFERNFLPETIAAIDKKNAEARQANPGVIPDFTISSEGIIEKPIESTAYPLLYMVPGKGAMRKVATWCSFRETTVNPDGQLSINGLHFVPYICYNKQWYKGDNEKGFLEKRATNLPPNWDIAYTANRAWELECMIDCFVHEAVVADITQIAGEDKSGTVVPSQYGSTCGPDSLQTILMFADGFRGYFDKMYKTLFKMQPSLSINNLKDELRAPHVSCPIVPGIGWMVEGNPFANGLTSRRPAARASLFEWLNILGYLYLGKQITEAVWSGIDPNVRIILTFALGMCVRKKSWEETYGSEPLTHVRGSSAIHVISHTHGGRQSNRRKRTIRKLRKYISK